MNTIILRNKSTVVFFPLSYLQGGNFCCYLRRNAVARQGAGYMLHAATYFATL